MLQSTQTLAYSSLTLERERFHGLDAARAIALLIGIFFHGVESLVSFLPPMIWAVKDAQSSVVIDSFFYVGHVFRMQAFFLISGFFAHMLYHSRGVQGFLAHRIKRIGLPLILFWPFIYASTHMLWVWGYKQMGYLALNPTTAKLGYWEIVRSNFTSFSWLDGGFPLTHLWFLYILLWFCAVVLLIRPMVDKWIDRKGKLRAGADKIMAYIMNRWWGSLVIGMITIPAMWEMKNGFGVDTPDHGLLPKLAPFLVYGFYFTFGWLLHRQKALLDTFKKYWKVNLLFSLILIGMVAFSFFSVVYQSPMPGQSAAAQPVDPATIKMLSLVYNSLYGIASMAGVFAFIGLMMTFFSHPSKRIRYLSDASYWMYLIHLPVVVLFQILVASYPWHWFVKIILILLPSLSVLLLSYHFLVRHTWMGSLLNGRKYTKNMNQELNEPTGITS